MEARRPGLYIGAAWQIVRFAVLGLVTVVGTLPSPVIAKTTLLLWLAPTQLSMSAAFFMLGRAPERYHAYKSLLLLGKALDLVPGLAILSFQAAAVFFGVGMPLFQFLAIQERIGLGGINLALSFYLFVVLVVLLDLLFLFLLLSLSTEREAPDPPTFHHLPDLQETQIKEE